MRNVWISERPARAVSHNLSDWRGISAQLYHAVIAFAWIYRAAMYYTTLLTSAFVRHGDARPEDRAFLLLRNFAPPPPPTLFRLSSFLGAIAPEGQKPGERSISAGVSGDNKKSPSRP